MTRDWAAEEAALNQELAEARKRLDAAFHHAAPGLKPQASTNPADLRAFGQAKDHHEAVKARRTAFLIERARDERSP